jgi:hypothetical protein
MITAIILDDTGSRAALETATALTSTQGLIGQTLIATADTSLASSPTAQVVSDDSLVAALKRAASEAASKRVVIISSALSIDAANLQAFLQDINGRNLREQAIVQIATAEGDLEAIDLSPDSIISALGKQDQWPLLLLATNRSTLLLVANSSAESTTELVVQALIRAIADGDTVTQAASISATADAHNARALISLSAEARARCLSTAVDAFNIEEMFASHNWESFSNEAAAASYHSLAALFLKFGDTASAIQCLHCSEMLEESPRYFALKGLIQQAKGETLGAVANLVSSLQCYESRKIDDGKHYLTFKPQNLEVINSRLVEGLNALNNRENESAVSHFSEAVFNFDPFYAEYGVSGLAKSR